MSTATASFSQTIPNINWEVFKFDEREKIEKLIERGHVDQLGAVLYQISPEQEQEIAKIQAALRPRNHVFESRKQREFEVWLATHMSELTPEIEAQWQKEIEEERNAYLEAMSGGGVLATTSSTATGDGTTNITSSNNVADIKGLTPNALKKLNEMSVFTVKQFVELPYDVKRKVLGIKVAAQFKDFNPTIV